MNLDQTQPVPRPDSTVFARYRLKSELGRGGMGVVWRGEDTKLQRDVALKFLPDFVVRDREAMSDLAAETRRCLALTHPHIVRVYDLVEEGNRAAISMEFVDGPSLAERKLRQPDRCFSVDTITPWIAQLCSALDYAHSKVRIVHRDLKPFNLLVNSEGDLKVVDFGIARSLSASETRLSHEAKSSTVSLGYVGPQQLLGEPAAVSDDIYSLGATIYELLTGRPPFYDGDVITQLREVVPPKMTARRAALGASSRHPIPPAWEETVAACLAKKAENRPASAAEVAARLGFPLGGTSSFLDPASLKKPATAVAASRARLRLGLAAAAIVALVAGGILWLKYDPAEPAVVTLAKKSAPATAVPTPPPPAPAPAFVVTITPPDVAARVWLGKEADKLVPDSGRLGLAGLPDGDFDLTVQATGYQTHTSKVHVADGRGEAAVTLVPVYGLVQFIARPGTLVTAVDARGHEKKVGVVPPTGPLKVDRVLTVGTYLFELAHPDCADIDLPNTALVAGRMTTISPPQTPLPGELRVFSEPDGAEVLINGVKVGVTPATATKVPSEKALAVEIYLPGYRREKRTVTLKPNEAQPLNAGALTLESGSVALRVGNEDFRIPRATARVDGHEVPLKGNRLDGLEVGSREVEILHPDFEPWKQTVTVKDHQVTPVVVKLVPKPAEVTLAVTGAPGYTLTANGKPIAVKNGRATVPANEEVTLEVSAKGFRTDRRKVTLPARGKHSVTLALEKVAQPEVAHPWTVPELGLVVLPVEAGTFSMGSENGDPSERPLTRVTLTKPFWLGKNEVTQKQYAAITGTNPSRFKGDDLPVENVSWADAMEFCRKLNDREKAADRLPAGYAYTLPTEAQWEYACRAGATGDNPADIATNAWHEGNSAATTHPVATKPANAWGFHDMLGNVWEWCSDWYVDKHKGGAVTDPKGNPNGSVRVRRGGSYIFKPGLISYSTRGKGEPEFRTYNLGFRLALAPTP
jgi:formylglycine-generating enzyme required for sulfatase activity